MQVPGPIQYVFPPGGAAAAATPNALPQPFPTGPNSPFTPPRSGGFAPRTSFGTGRSQVSRWKECKISGQIGSPGQKDKLTYTGLSFQIESARQRGFDGPDICAAVIKAIVPGEDLRTYLEMCPDLRLETMIPILRAHFRETDATAVFTELSNGTQQPTESENDFCLRMMGLRQKVLLMSGEEKGQYSKDLVQDQFQKSLGTGFRREAVRQQLRAILKTPIEDIQLLKEVGEVVMTESEHSTKVKNRVAAQKLVVEEQTNTPKATTTKQANPLMTEISKLTAQISQLAGLRGEFEKLKHDVENQGTEENVQVDGQGLAFGSFGNADGQVAAASGGFGTGGFGSNGVGRGGYTQGVGRGGGYSVRGCFGRDGRVLGCPTCRQNGIFCRHCFGCGAEDHKHKNCQLNPKNASGGQC